MILDLTFAAIVGDLLDQSQQQASATAAGWDQMWATVITPNSGVYFSIARFGVVVAVGSLMIWGIKIIQDFVEAGTSAFLHQLIWPLIVISFLAGNGALLSQCTIGIRGFINEVNQDILANTSNIITLQDAYQRAKNHAVAKSQIGELLKQCQSITGEQQRQCLIDAKAQAEEIIAAYNLQGNWVTNFQDRMNEAIDNSSGPVDTVFSWFGALIGAGNQTIIRTVLIGTQVAFQQLLEVSLLLTGLMGPIALGASLLPVGAKPIFAWLISMFTVGLNKICFNIIAGLAATVIVNAEASDPLWFLLFVAFMAPALSTALAAGAGMAIWSAALEGVERITEGAATATTLIAKAML